MQWRGEISTQQLVWRLVPVFILALLFKGWLANRLGGKYVAYELPEQGHEFLKSIVFGHFIAWAVALLLAFGLSALIIHYTLKKVDIYRVDTPDRKESVIGKIWGIFSTLCLCWIMIMPFWMGYKTLIFQGNTVNEVIAARFAFTESFFFPFIFTTWGTMILPLFILSRRDKTHFLPKDSIKIKGGEI